MHDFVARDMFTMWKTPQFPPWRPDKIVTSNKCNWKAVDAHIAGNYGINEYAGQ